MAIPKAGLLAMAEPFLTLTMLEAGRVEVIVDRESEDAGRDVGEAETESAVMGETVALPVVLVEPAAAIAATVSFHLPVIPLRSLRR